MKHIAAACMLTALLAASACAGKTATAPASEPDAPMSLAAAPVIEAVAPITPNPAATATPAPFARQYGEETTLVADGNGFSGALTYPQGGVQPINRAIADWAGQTQRALEARAMAEDADADGMRATMAIDYDAYLSQDRFVGVKETGVYRAVVSGETSPVLFAYNYDLVASKRLTLSDVIDPTQMAAVRALVTERLGWLDAAALSEAGALTAATMQDFVIRGDGIEWLFISEAGVTGILLDYAALAPYIRLDAPVRQQPATGAAAGDAIIEQKAICLHDGAQVRTLPSLTEGATIGTLAAGEGLDVVRSNAPRGWHAVRYRGETAFVHASLVQLDGEEEKYVTGWVTSTYLHVRARASVYSELLGTMVYQEPVRVIDTTPIGGWYKIWYEGGIAYVHARYVSLALYPPEATATPDLAATGEAVEAPRILRQTLAPIVGVGACATEGAIVYSAPNVRASAYGTLSVGEQVFIVQEACAPGWDRIFVYTEANSGYIGYVQARYVRSFVPDGAEAQ